ncbi:MAG: hypothetical protein HY660_00320 [Armatimonadetes bacterium]|nr:hypothetical protein [Armatimonadota bacterium]
MSVGRVSGLVLCLMLTAGLAPHASAAPAVTVPAGTKVALKFLREVDSSKIKAGATVRFSVVADVIVGRAVVIRAGAPARGTVTDVVQPGIFGRNAQVHMSFLEVTAVDRRPIRLTPMDITPNSVRQVKDTGGAVGTSAVGLILLGPVGLAAGGLIRGGHVKVGVGSIGISAVTATVRVRA